MQLEALGITARYEERTVLHSVGFVCRPEQIILVAGHNGCGKSTLLKVLVGMKTPIGGSVELDGHDLTHVDMVERVRRGIILLPQYGYAFEDLTVRDHFAIALHVSRLSAAQRSGSLHLFDELLQEVGEWRAARALSVGQCKALAVESAALCSPVYFLLDEPLAGLSDDLANLCLRNLRVLASSLNCGIIIAEHRVSRVLPYVDHLLVLEQGHVVHNGVASEQAWSAARKSPYV